MSNLDKEFDVTLSMLLYSNDMVLAKKQFKQALSLIDLMRNNSTTEFDELSSDAAERKLNRTYELVKNYNENNNI